MAYFYIYETVTFPIQLSKEEALQNIEKVVCSIQQGMVTVNKIYESGDIAIDEEHGRIDLYLEQEDTAKFKVGQAALQVNLYYQNQERDVTTKAMLSVYDNLYKKVITDDD